MSVIAFVSPKGGVGKTTATLILAEQLARKATVRVIDADPNRPIEGWANRARVPANLQVVSDAGAAEREGRLERVPISQDNILQLIDESRAAARFTLIDLEGTANQLVAWSITQADLVIVPSGPSTLDSDQVARALQLINHSSKVTRRLIPRRVLFTRTSTAIRTRTLAAIQEQLAQHGIPALDCHLHDREAFRALFSHATTLASLHDEGAVSNTEKALKNAVSYANAVIAALKEEAQ